MSHNHPKEQENKNICKDCRKQQQIKLNSFEIKKGKSFQMNEKLLGSSNIINSSYYSATNLIPLTLMEFFYNNSYQLFIVLVSIFYSSLVNEYNRFLISIFFIFQYLVYFIIKLRVYLNL